MAVLVEQRKYRILRMAAYVDAQLEGVFSRLNYHGTGMAVGYNPTDKELWWWWRKSGAAERFVTENWDRLIAEGIIREEMPALARELCEVA